MLNRPPRVQQRCHAFRRMDTSQEEQPTTVAGGGLEQWGHIDAVWENANRLDKSEFANVLVFAFARGVKACGPAYGRALKQVPEHALPQRMKAERPARECSARRHHEAAAQIVSAHLSRVYVRHHPQAVIVNEVESQGCSLVDQPPVHFG